MTANKPVPRPRFEDQNQCRPADQQETRKSDQYPGKVPAPRDNRRPPALVQHRQKQAIKRQGKQASETDKEQKHVSLRGTGSLSFLTNCPARCFSEFPVRPVADSRCNRDLEHVDAAAE